MAILGPKDKVPVVGHIATSRAIMCQITGVRQWGAVRQMTLHRTHEAGTKDRQRARKKAERKAQPCRLAHGTAR